MAWPVLSAFAFILIVSLSSFFPWSSHTLSTVLDCTHILLSDLFSCQLFFSSTWTSFYRISVRSSPSSHSGIFGPSWNHTHHSNTLIDFLCWWVHYDSFAFFSDWKFFSIRKPFWNALSLSNHWDLVLSVPSSWNRWRCVDLFIESIELNKLWFLFVDQCFRSSLRRFSSSVFIPTFHVFSSSCWITGSQFPWKPCLSRLTLLCESIIVLPSRWVKRSHLACLHCMDASFVHWSWILGTRCVWTIISWLLYRFNIVVLLSSCFESWLHFSWVCMQIFVTK